jgi:hypothetical protein
MKTTLCLFGIALATALALPTGAPYCDIDGPAPRSLHLWDRGGMERITGPLADGTFRVMVGGIVLDAATTLEIDASTTYDIVITSESGTKQFRGVLGIIHNTNIGFTSRNLYRGMSDDRQNSTDCAETDGGRFSGSDPCRSKLEDRRDSQIEYTVQCRSRQI